MYHQLVTSVCTFSMYYQYVPSVCMISMCHLYVPSVCTISMYHLYVLSLCTISKYHQYVPFVILYVQYHLYVLYHYVPSSNIIAPVLFHQHLSPMFSLKMYNLRHSNLLQMSVNAKYYLIQFIPICV